MQILERNHANWIKLLIDIGELEAIKSVMSESQIKKEVQGLIDSIQD